jgi:hypothetical protein
MTFYQDRFLFAIREQGLLTARGRGMTHDAWFKSLGFELGNEVRGYLFNNQLVGYSGPDFAGGSAVVATLRQWAPAFKVAFRLQGTVTIWAGANCRGFEQFDPIEPLGTIDDVIRSVHSLLFNAVLEASRD